MEFIEFIVFSNIQTVYTIAEGYTPIYLNYYLPSIRIYGYFCYSLRLSDHLLSDSSLSDFQIHLFLSELLLSDQIAGTEQWEYAGNVLEYNPILENNNARHTR
jgi:hypothetical protein